MNIASPPQLQQPGFYDLVIKSTAWNLGADPVAFTSPWSHGTQRAMQCPPTCRGAGLGRAKTGHDRPNSPRASAHPGLGNSARSILLTWTTTCPLACHPL